MTLTQSDVFIREVQLTLTEKNNADNKITITSTGSNDSIRIRFDITKTMSSIANQLNIEIYNLKRSRRNQLSKTQFQVELKCGYMTENILPTLSVADLATAISYRDGPDIITRLVAFEGYSAITQSFINKTYDNSASLDFIVRDLASKFKTPNGHKPIEIGDINVTNVLIANKGIASGPTIKYTLDTLSMQYGFTWGISNNKFTAISDILSPKNTFLISNSNKNLINDYPSFYSASQVARSIQIDTILDARLQPFSGVRIKESINQNLIDGSLQTGTSNGNTQKTNDKGTFRINYISHNGDTHGGNYNTRLECFVYANEGQGDIVQ